ncbi:GNAT family N-acetyltransferase [Photobacterium aphoticum]|uniref:tRNA(Met) cytidine acetyltransferase TmcA n=1 Tax=Photobacterium aphoticum TaxID=754436 RepID=A0A0J1JBU1_9GAMM|nr:GNAT family N-acetyltransferase [Photobacterium aphoticum]KLU99061.1 hypothetical protein ABT58_18765 [Photobacterium aphoticum]GHA45878.1 tRNA(Met) cytidine acetyltransferase TmcA [Photobacterium aphoticum]
MKAVNEFLGALSQTAKQAHCRFLVVVRGSETWAKTVNEALIPHYVSPLYCGPSLAWGTDAQWVPFKLAKKWLGRESDLLMMNGYDGVDAEAVGALSGTVVGGGLMVLMVSSDFGGMTDSRFHQRLARHFSALGVVVLNEDQALPLLPGVPADVSVEEEVEAQPQVSAPLPFGALTPCQADAIMAIRRVVTGHRKRPVVLTADRGRGKSSALGLAAASLLAERGGHIAITAPSYAAAETVFRHVALQAGVTFTQQRALEWGEGRMTFVAPDALLVESNEYDSVFVDEAAAIPAPLLAGLLARFSRLVFASTVHGYEGTGRGFAVKFRQMLDAAMPQWRSVTLSTPIRWAMDDPLELWVFEALLLNAELPVSVYSASAHVTHQRISSQHLLDNEVLLAGVFGLLVNAHYQTSPADLVNLLDDPALQLFVSTVNEQVIACALVMEEGGFSDELIGAIQRGERRPKGHLLAQSLAAHVGIGEAAAQRAGRVLRIAVHPDWQQQGMGSALLTVIQQWATTRWDYLGTSFGYLPELFGFWLRNGYHPVRLGFTRDATSGYPSLLCVLPLSQNSQAWWPTAQTVFSATLSAHWFDGYASLSAQQGLPLWRYQQISFPSLPVLPASLMEQHLILYTQGGLGLEAVQPALQQWLQQQLCSVVDDNTEGLALVFAKVIQRKGWADVVNEFGLTGRKHAEQAVRLFVQTHYC